VVDRLQAADRQRAFRDAESHPVEFQHEDRRRESLQPGEDRRHDHGEGKYAPDLEFLV